MSTKKKNQNAIIFLLIAAALIFLFKGATPFLGSLEEIPCGGNLTTGCSGGFICVVENESVSTGTCQPVPILECVASGGSWINVVGNETTLSSCVCPQGSSLTNFTCTAFPDSTLCTSTGGSWSASYSNSSQGNCTCPATSTGYKAKMGCEYATTSPEPKTAYFVVEGNQCTTVSLSPSEVTSSHFTSRSTCEDSIPKQGTTPSTGAQPVSPPEKQSATGTSKIVIAVVALALIYLFIKNKGRLANVFKK